MYCVQSHAVLFDDNVSLGCLSYFNEDDRIMVSIRLLKGLLLHSKVCKCWLGVCCRGACVLSLAG